MSQDETLPAQWIVTDTRVNIGQRMWFASETEALAYVTGMNNTLDGPIFVVKQAEAEDG